MTVFCELSPLFQLCSGTIHPRAGVISLVPSQAAPCYISVSMERIVDSLILALALHGMELESRQLYQYDTLAQDGSFHTLILQPGIGDEPLECRLETSLMCNTSSDTISYVWGP
jgi:hypothetical protein